MDGELWLLAVKGNDAAAGLTLLALPALAAPTYTVTDLGTLGGTNGYGYCINASGEVTGDAATP